MLMMIAAACSKKDSPGTPPPDDRPRTGTVAPVGVPDGSAIARKTIGAAGGDLTSTDGLLKVTVPAGSFSADQQVSIQRITNTNPIQTNSAYRILPEGVTFSKPVQLTFSYTDADVKGSMPEALGIAFQNKQGIWTALPVTRNTQTQKITVATTHFSDWSVFKFLELKAEIDVLPMDQATNVTALLDWGLYYPKAEGTPISKLIPVPADLIKSWKLNGSGTLTTSGNPRVYKAPKFFAGKPLNPATITVELTPPNNIPGKYLLATEIKTDAGWVEYRVGSGAWHKLDASPAMITDGRWNLYANTDEEDGRDITFYLGGWTSQAPGGFNWTMTHTAGSVMCTITQNNEEWASYYDDPETAARTFIASPGMVDVTKIENGYITGTFSGSRFGIHSSDMKTWTRVEGRFHIMLTIPQ